MVHKKNVSVFFLIILLVRCEKQKVSIPDDPEQENEECVDSDDENKDSTGGKDEGDESLPEGNHSSDKRDSEFFLIKDV